MANDYFNHSDIGDHTSASSSGLNSIFSAITTAFGYLPGRSAIRRMNWTFVEDTGAADAYVITRTDADTAYADGMRVMFKVGAGNTNTGACTANVDGLGARSIKLVNGNNPAAGDLTAGDFIEMVYDADNSQFVIMSAVRSMFS